MRLSPEQMVALMTHYYATPVAPRSHYLTYATSMALLSHLPYVPVERDQGACNDCWAWAGTGVMEIAHDVQNKVRDRLSLQFINSCNPSVPCCEGGSLYNVESFYSSSGFAIPWSNPNAGWVSGSGSCDTPCGAIVKTPGLLRLLPAHRRRLGPVLRVLG
jgi:hypothetical protein